jgi:hypothetical protein
MSDDWRMSSEAVEAEDVGRALQVKGAAAPALRRGWR